MLDITRIRDQFPITGQRFEVTGELDPRPLIYMDHGASTHPPTAVLETYKDFLDGIFNTEDEVDEMVRMIGVIRDRAWKGDYGEIPGAAACKEL